ncbi:MAG TPA: beta-galactosidase, partial [Candidatus Alistipes excrementipullorum]|nr:beta-galactosidase [Candidatus Alistipes excrementipullorum]
MKRSILLLLFLFLLSSGVNAQVRIAGSPGEGYALTVDGEKVFIKGTCGRVTLEDTFGRATMGEAARRGANAYRTYSSDSTTVARAVEAASRHGMYLMMGISLPKNPARYRDEAFRQKMREQCTALAERYADDRNIIVWALGNELNMGEGIGEEGWRFVEELAVLMKERDSRHLTCTVLSSARAAGFVGRLCPSLDFVGINSYGG